MIPAGHDRHALRGAAFTFVGDPFATDAASAFRYEPDAAIVIVSGRIAAFGPYGDLQASLAGVPVTHHRDALILPGFIDAHVHYPQTQIIGAHGRQLIDWINDYTFVAEQSFADEDHCRAVAEVFLEQCLRAGTTTAAVFCTVHAASVDAFFEAAAKRNMRMIAGKVLMDRNAPDGLRDTATSGYDQSKALIGRWHGRGRALYAVTPRFAPTSSPAQLEAASALWRETPGSFLQSHVSENPAEIAWARSLFPQRRGYLDIYDHYGLLGPRAIYGHGIWLDEAELARCHETGTAIAHCPSSNAFLGSGLFSVRNATRADRPVRVALASDLGAGTSFSPLQTMGDAYKIAQLGGASLSAAQAFFLATRGAAAALGLADTIGSIAVGCEADLVVLDLRSTPLIAFRMKHCANLEEALFVQMTLGDDRATLATYVAGERCYERA